MRGFLSKSTKRRAAAAATALAAVLAAGVLPAAANPETASRRARSVTVSIHDFAFHPHKVTISPGTKVVFANRDPIRHTATDRGSFDTGRIAPGSSVSVRFNRAGTYPFACKIHPEMHGKVVVG